MDPKDENRTLNMLGVLLCLLILGRFQFSQLWLLGTVEVAIGAPVVDGRLPQETTIQSELVNTNTSNSGSKCELKHCHLSQLQLDGPVYLWSMIASSAVETLAHFLEHYIAVGIPPENMNFLIHKADNGTQLDKVYEILAGYGVDVNKTTSVYTGLFHSTIKRDNVNEFIKTLPFDAWLTYADLDEFFHYPCRKPGHFRTLCGKMVDRIHSHSPNITLAATDPLPSSRPLSEQFPQCVNLRGNLVDADPKKHMIFRAREEDGNYVATFTSAHQLNYQRLNGTSRSRLRNVPCRPEKLGIFDHYGWSMEQIHLLQSKSVRYSKDSHRGPIYSILMNLVEQKKNVTGGGGGWSFSNNVYEQLNKATVCCPNPHTGT